MKTTVLFLSLPLTLGLSASALSETEIAVGVYDFPPVAAIRDNSRLNGLLGDLLVEMESTQQDISFRIVHTSPKRRHLDFEAGLYDVIFFESIGWGWESQSVDATPPVLKHEEVYVALNKPGRDQSFFDNIAARTIAVISGYHYGFAGLSTNNAELQERFQIEFSDSHERNLKLIKVDRPSLAEVAVVSRSYLEMHMAQHPEDNGRFLISDKIDQVSLLRILTRENGPVSAEALQQLLSPLIEDGRYQQLVKRHGLLLPPTLAGH